MINSSVPQWLTAWAMQPNRQEFTFWHQYWLGDLEGVNQFLHASSFLT